VALKTVGECAPELVDVVHAPEHEYWLVHIRAAIKALAGNVTLRALLHLLDRRGFPHKRETLRKMLGRMNLVWKCKTRTTFLSDSHRQARVEFATKLLQHRELLHLIVFTDEKFFTPGGVNKRTWMPKGTKMYDRSDRREGIMGFLMISCHGKWSMYWYEPREKINGKRYLETVQKYCCSPITWFGDDHPTAPLVFQEDNAPCHFAAEQAVEKRQALREANLVPLCEAYGLKWPSKSPDLSPIENVWAWLDFKVRANPVYSHKQLKHVVNQHLESAEGQLVVAKMMASFVTRLEKVIKMHGANVQNTDPRDVRALPCNIDAP
jgi:hypothetical protein